jgi:diadenylate cyclase
MPELVFLLKIGFLPIRIWDVLDVLIVGYLLYQLYKLLRGSIAFNIFIGVVILSVAWWLVGILEMDLLTVVLDQFVSVGVIILIIIFQPEVRRFLLMLGNTTLRQQSHFLRRFLDRNMEGLDERKLQMKSLRDALKRMARYRIGALVVLSDQQNLDVITNSGVLMEARISQPLIESVFQKESPLHDGAMLITDGKVHAASCILPVSDNASLPRNSGLRHRAGVGVTEVADVSVFIVSEEDGKISFAYKGVLENGLSDDRLGELLERHFPK